MRKAVRRFAAVLVVGAGFALLCGCNESRESAYANIAAADKNQAFEDGWLPAVLRPDATDIREFHDLDTEHGGATFHYPKEMAQRLRTDCTRLPDDQPIHSPFTAWPPVLHTGETPVQLASRNIDVSRCDDFLIFLDHNTGIGYLSH